jgi:hypothetical protein
MRQQLLMLLSELLIERDPKRAEEYIKRGLSISFQ